MNKFFKYLVLCSLMAIATVAYAQTGEGTQFTQNTETFAFDFENPNPGNTVPIDGGISLLAAAGIAYGGKKLYDTRMKNITDTDTD